MRTGEQQKHLFADFLGGRVGESNGNSERTILFFLHLMTECFFAGLIAFGKVKL